MASAGLHGLERSSPGSFFLGPDSPLDDYQELGFPGLDRPPADQLTLLASCNGRYAHLLLGRLALFLAGCFDALIDFGGLLGCRYDTSDRDEAACLAQSRALVASLPGRVREMPYVTYGEGGCGYSHVGDREFLAAWLDHPDFRMIK